MLVRLLPRLRAALLGLAAATLPDPAAAQPGPVGTPEGPMRAQVHRIPFDADGGVLLPARVCRPAGGGAAPQAIISHGSATAAAIRNQYPLLNCGPTAQWFVQRGYVVAMPLRRGYGIAGGTHAEGYGSCEAPDYVRAGEATADDIAAVVRYMRTLPYVARDRMILAGASGGGWGSLAYASRVHDGPVAVLNFAGGRGGYRGNRPNENCAPDRLVAAAASFGRTVRVPTLWVYSENDSFFDPGLAQRMHRAFVAAGGRAQLEQLGPFGNDGHYLSGEIGSESWTAPHG